jgi:hypothetical protein
VQGVSLYNIRAETFESTAGTIASVKLTIQGPRNSQRNENVAPYALFGDNSGKYFGSVLPSGDYVVTAQAFTQQNGQGEASEIFILEFSV